MNTAEEVGLDVLKVEWQCVELLLEDIGTLREDLSLRVHSQVGLLSLGLV